MTRVIRIRSASSREKDDLMLRALEMRDAGMTTLEIAERLGSTPATWRNAIRRVWRDLAECTE